jgi:hypothetical protein
MPSFADRLEQELVRGIQDLGAAVFRDSQRDVPVRTGRLKRSGYIRRLSNGVEIGYTAPYAFSVEHGDWGLARPRGGPARPQSVSSASIFVRRPGRRPPRVTAGARPRRFLQGAVDRNLPGWGKTVEARLQRAFGR